MKVVLVGAGKVGRKVARRLAKRYDVVVVDKDPDLVSDLNESLDVMAFEGDGTSLQDLRRAGVEKADYLIAATESDLVNIVICGLGKTLGNPFTIARVKNYDFVNVWSKGRSVFGVDLMICSNPLVARDISNAIEYPSADLLRILFSDYLLAVTSEKPEIPEVWSIRLNKKYLSVIPRWSLNKALKPNPPKRIILAGGSTTNVLLAKMLETRGYRPVLVELDRERAVRIAKELKRTNVEVADVLSPDYWKNIKASVTVISLDKDEKTLLASLLARNEGIEGVYAVIHTEDYLEPFRICGIKAFSPEGVTAERITVAAQAKHIKNIITTIPGYEIITIEAYPGSRIVGKKLDELKVRHAQVGPVLSHGRLFLPSNEHTLEAGDLLTLVVKEEELEEVEL